MSNRKAMVFNCNQARLRWEKLNGAQIISSRAIHLALASKMSVQSMSIINVKRRLIIKECENEYFPFTTFI